MSIRDVLLPLVGESSRTTMVAIEKCVALARGLDARVTALAVETEDEPVPSVADVLGTADIVQTAPTARALLAAFATAAKKHALRNEQKLERTTRAAVIDAVADAGAAQRPLDRAGQDRRIRSRKGWSSACCSRPAGPC